MGLTLLTAGAAAQEPTGSIRGVVYDQDFEAPLAAAQIMIVETGQKAESTDQGNYVLADVPPGTYTLVFSKEGYVRQVKADVVVSPGRLTDLDVWLSGDFTDMEEYVVQDILAMGGSSEAALLQLRIESPALMDSIGADFISRAGASDAASALTLISGATVQDGKFAVVRGLPDRYVSNQLNGVRLPTADEDKRAVELDQFPATVIESLQVTKTFTPDQQGDASGGAVDVRLKGIPEDTLFSVKAEYSYNTNVRNRDDFLTYDGGGLGTLNNEGNSIQKNNLGGNWDGAVGVSEGSAPIDYKLSTAIGGKHDLDNGWTVGAFASLFYERDSSYFDDGKDNSYWVFLPGEPLTPQFQQGNPGDGDFKTALFDVTQGTQTEQYGGVGTVGLEDENNYFGLTYLYTKTTEDTATLAEDTRGKNFYFPGYEPNNPESPGNLPENRLAAPYLRTETLEYTEREVDSLQFTGEHTLPFEGLQIGDVATFKRPVFDWTYAQSKATLDQPDKRQFGSLWLGPSQNQGFPPFIDPFISPPTHQPFKPAANFNLGNLQRIWKTIDEDSDQYFVNLELPFEQWSGEEGYIKVGLFDDETQREFRQESFSNFGDAAASFEGDFDEFWTGVWTDENHPITESLIDVDYDGDQDIKAYYAMMDLPLNDQWTVIGGFRVERTDLDIDVTPEEEAVWFPPGADAPVVLGPDDADVSLNQRDVLPSIALVYEPIEEVVIRGSYSETIARPTFKELTPVLQQEFLGGPIFIGNPDIQLSAVENYDLRVDYTPYEGGLVSVSYFKKKIDDAIENVQKVVQFTYTTVENFPKGELDGWEFEVRQNLDTWWEPLTGMAAGANLTFIDSEVTLPKSLRQEFELPNIQASQKTRDMTGTPDHLYNFYLTYDIQDWGTRASIFYTVTGDALVAGAAQDDGNYVPDVYADEFDSLNFTLQQALGEFCQLTFKAKNLTNPKIKTYYSDEFTTRERTRTSFTRGRDYSISLGVNIPF